MKFLDYNGLQHLIAQIKDKFVAKVEGKTLSDNNYSDADQAKVGAIPESPKYTDTTYTEATVSLSGLMSKQDKAKLDGVQAGATVNRIELIKRNGSALNIESDKSVNISVPIKVSDLTNDQDYQTKTEIINLIGLHAKLKKAIVSILPAVEGADENTIYLVAKESAEGQSGYLEFLKINGVWEQIGDTGADVIDLSGYVKTSDLVAISNPEIDAMMGA